MTAIALRRLTPFRARRGTSAPELVVRADLDAPDGRRWWAVAGGSTAEEAVATARGALPRDAGWEISSLRVLYGQ